MKIIILGAGQVGGTLAENLANERNDITVIDTDAERLRELGDRLDMDAMEAAWGLAEVVDENMANAARVHAVENGEDLSEYTMIAFGGAAPLHAGRLCEKLGVERCLVPPAPASAPQSGSCARHSASKPTAPSS